jgi:CHAD domain-containing protein
LPAGDLQERLRPVMKTRAAQPAVLLKRRSETSRMVSSEGKVIGRVRFLAGRADFGEVSADLPERIVFEARKGCREEVAQLASLAESAGAAVEERSEIELAVEATGRRVLDYSSKPQVHLEPAGRAAEGVRVAIAELMNQMRRNERGVLDDTDTEFLHDFRVSVRRLRSLIGQVKGVIEPGLAARAKADLREISEATGPVRDLDVLVLNRSNYRSMLPASLHPGLDLFFERLTEERTRAFEAMAAKIGSPWYDELVSRWATILDRPLPAGSLADDPLVLVARRSILKQLNRVGKSLRAMRRQSSSALEAESLHALRIDCKKLRYLYEIFANLFPADSLRPLIKPLKLLQDRLGDYHDLVVHQHRLENDLRRVDTAHRDGVAMAAALGGVITRLAEEQTARLPGLLKAASRFKHKPHRETVGGLLSEKRA